MALGNINAQQTETKWLSIHHGKVELSYNGHKQLFGYVEGNLSYIYKKERYYNGEAVLKWFINLRDDKGDCYSISFPYQSGTFKSIVLALASCSTLTGSTSIRIEPYIKGNFTNVVVYADGKKLDWAVRELPPVEYVTINGQRVKDETQRMELITSYVSTINQRIKGLR